ncbi:hypothetical protein [Bradyrhizobium iriomotense]|uniref:Uncharacterized protein n=1 Tax=Bradyrhizobium iriomotense TaxID=441950 RepID=A0ABQ6B6F0_9BRAD|nr:hypothetical protein [Bradyrhizobium iriomotense]GLR87632.1 hypothetical protein GCM10007857_43430 [Bradyrhizobium iriomotense]
MELEQRLSVALGKLIEQAAPRDIRQRVEQPVEIHLCCLHRYISSCNNLVA